LIFEGNIDEAEVGKLQEGMELQLTIGAIEGKTFEANLEYIAPKGNKDGDGAVQFRIKAAVVPEDGVRIRAGYSSNAKIVLARKEKVLTLPESLILYEKDQKPFVEVAVGEQKFEKRAVELGLSDGLNVEIVKGLTKADHVKKPGPETAPKDRS